MTEVTGSIDSMNVESRQTVRRWEHWELYVRLRGMDYSLARQIHQIRMQQLETAGIKYAAICNSNLDDPTLDRLVWNARIQNYIKRRDHCRPKRK